MKSGINSPIRLVLDTNVVIDWLVFDDPYMNPLRHGVRDGRITVLTHAPAISELQRVLAYRQLKLEPARQVEVFTAYQDQSTAFNMPADFSLKNLLLPGDFPRCRDRDDEHFLALAFHSGADALVSRDNAVFGLKRRAAKFAMNILNVQEMIAMLGSVVVVR